MAVINAARVMKETNIAKQSQLQFEREFGAREKALAEQEAALKVLGEKMEAENWTLAESQRGQRKAQWAAQTRDFQQKARALQEDKNAVRRADAQKIIELADQVVKRVAATEHFDLVLREAVYFNPAVDITEKVIAGMNAQVSQ